MNLRTWRTAGLVASLAIAALLAGCGNTGMPRASTPANSAAAANLQLGAAYLQQGDLPIAKEKLERAVAQSPRDPAIHGMLAMLYQRLGDSHRADEEFRNALSLAPHDPQLLNNYAVYLCDTGRVDEGVKRFADAARDRLYSTPWAAYTNAGVCLRGARRDAEAEPLFAKALEVRPDYAEALIQLADLQLRLDRAPEAYARVEKFLRVNPPTAEVLMLGWRAARAQDNKVNAAQMAWRLQTEFPDSEQAHALGVSRSGKP